MKKEFDNYVKAYDLNDYNTQYKYKHSIRVMKICEALANNMGLNEEDTYIIKTIGLLHDIGRFDQIKFTSSYDDSEFDHAAYGAMILFKENLIEQFNVDPKYYDIIEFAIRNHNRYKIEDINDERKLMFAKLIRDADKIDIFDAYTYLNAYNITDNLDDVTTEVVIQFKKCEPINIKTMKTRADKLLNTFAFVFDINYNESLEIINSQGFIDELFNRIEDNARFREYYEIAKDYIKERLDKNDR